MRKIFTLLSPISLTQCFGMFSLLPSNPTSIFIIFCQIPPGYGKVFNLPKHIHFSTSSLSDLKLWTIPVKHSDLLATNLLPCVEQFQIFIAEKTPTSLKKDV